MHHERHSRLFECDLHLCSSLICMISRMWLCAALEFSVLEHHIMFLEQWFVHLQLRHLHLHHSNSKYYWIYIFIVSSCMSYPTMFQSMLPYDSSRHLRFKVYYSSRHSCFRVWSCISWYPSTFQKYPTTTVFGIHVSNNLSCHIHLHFKLSWYYGYQHDLVKASPRSRHLPCWSTIQSMSYPHLTLNVSSGWLLFASMPESVI